MPCGVQLGQACLGRRVRVTCRSGTLLEGLVDAVDAQSNLLLREAALVLPGGLQLAPVILVVAQNCKYVELL